MNNRKSQAALEFLTTYAWAFIVIIIIIAAIAYFGILSPSKILPDRCNFNVGFDCQAYTITRGATGLADGSFTLRLKNGLGKTVDVTGVTLTAESTTAYACPGPPPPVFPTGWPSGEIRTITWSACNSNAVGFSVGEKGKILVRLNYFETKAGPTFPKIADGEIFTTVT